MTRIRPRRVVNLDDRNNSRGYNEANIINHYWLRKSEGFDYNGADTLSQNPGLIK